MDEYVIYESPKEARRRSAPIAASDIRSRQHLESMGWKLVEEYSADSATAAAFTASAIKADAFVPEVEPETNEAIPESEPAFALDAIDGLTDAQRAALESAGYADEDVLRAASDDDLLAVDGIGKAALRHIREALEA